MIMLRSKLIEALERTTPYTFIRKMTDKQLASTVREQAELAYLGTRQLGSGIDEHVIRAALKQLRDTGSLNLTAD